MKNALANLVSAFFCALQEGTPRLLFAFERWIRLK